MLIGAGADRTHVLRSVHARTTNHYCAAVARRYHTHGTVLQTPQTPAHRILATFAGPSRDRMGPGIKTSHQSRGARTRAKPALLWSLRARARQLARQPHKACAIAASTMMQRRCAQMRAACTLTLARRHRRTQMGAGTLWPRRARPSCATHLGGYPAQVMMAYII